MAVQENFYRQRALRHRALAKAARDPNIAAIHRELADRYGNLASMAEADGQADAPAAAISPKRA